VELEAHALAEEQTFYAELMEAPEATEKARHSVAEHKDAAELLDQLTELEMSSGGWIHKFEKLQHEVVHHVDEEEDEVFPLAQGLISADKARELGRQFDERKRAESS
jgi:iron-sulfur cluster repair protein YtfE (RIC family)